MNFGLIYVILANFFWALELVLVRKFFPNQNAIFISGITSIFASLLYLPTLFFTKERLAPTSLLILFLLGLLSFFLAQIFYIRGIQAGTSTFAVALTTLSMPLFSVIMAAIFLKETLSLPIIVGGILMVIGFLIISLK